MSNAAPVLAQRDMKMYFAVLYIEKLKLLLYNKVACNRLKLTAETASHFGC